MRREYLTGDRPGDRASLSTPPVLVHPSYLFSDHRGHGVKAMQSIRRGQFVIEYSGEVLDSAELEFRMAEARRTGEQHFYVMELDPGEQECGECV